MFFASTAQRTKGLAASGHRIWLVLRAHVLASPAKSTALGVLMLVLLVLVIRQVAGGPQAAGAGGAVQRIPAAWPELEAQVAPLRLPVGLPLPALPERPARNPFWVDPSLFAAAPGTELERPGSGTEVSAADPVAAALGELRLQSTVTGPVPMAMIAGTLLRVGDRIRGFRVERIGVRFVELEYAGRRFTLTMD